MSANQTQVQHDPDFRSTVRADSFRPSPEGLLYRRIIANPFPLVFALTIGVALSQWFTRSLDSKGRATLAVVALATLAWASPRLLRFNCLDCGATGRLHLCNRHICPEVAQRIATATPARHRPPPLSSQLIAQTLLLALLLFLALTLAE